MSRKPKPPAPNLDHIAEHLRQFAVPIDSLEIDPENARLHDDPNRASIRASLIERGQILPITVRAANRRIMTGNGTTEEALALGWTHIAATFHDYTEEQAVAWAIAHNRTAELAAWDFGQLAATMEAHPDVDWVGVGWEPAELESILEQARVEADAPEPETTTVGEHEREVGTEAEDEVPDPPAEPITKVGDMWILGDHVLICGDSFDPDVRAKLLEGAKAALALMDPPFAIYGSSTGIGADIADDKMIRPFFRDLGHAIVQSIAEFAHVYVCCDWRSWASVWAGMTAAKLSPKNCLVWNKGGGGLGSMYTAGHEFIGFFCRLPPPTAMKSSAHGKQQRTVLGASNVLNYTRPSGAERHHNAAKPVAMLAHLIENSSDAGDVVLDLFNGSGSVIMAGEQTGRRVRACEIEPSWCDVTVARWEKATGKRAERIPALLP